MPSVELPELRELDAIRLEHDWTWAELADDMAAKGAEVPARTLHYLIKGHHEFKPLDRTIHKIRHYLANDEARRARRNRAARARKATTPAPNG